MKWPYAAVGAPAAAQISLVKLLDASSRAAAAEGQPATFHITGLPAGATWDPDAKRLTFTPDFIQGGLSHRITAVLDDADQPPQHLDVTVQDTITPPLPRIINTEDMGTYERLTIEQTTDAFLDSPGHAGRTFEAIITVPKGTSAQNQRPVRVTFHGFFGSPWREGWEGEFRIAAHDPSNTYWWGYNDQLPGEPPNTGTTPPYTQRRVLNLLGWVLKQYPGADQNRIYAEGASMGGTGAAAFGLLHCRHVAWISATIFQPIARNHRPSRVGQLSGLWGSPEQNFDDGTGMGVWDRLDLTDTLATSPCARDRFIFLKHGKDDPIIHFGAVTQPSPRTSDTFYQALQKHHVGHLAIWDEGGHGVPDPLLGDAWWDTGWNPIFDGVTWLRRDHSFPAFSQSSVDDDPGDDQGNGRVPWDPESGFSASLTTPGDTGWSGDIAGALGRSLRWDSAGIIDTPQRWSVPIKALNADGGPAPQPGYPTTGDRLDGTPPITVDVTPRRLQAFRPTPGTTIQWTYAAQSGQTTVAADGTFTIPTLQLSSVWQTLECHR